MIQIQKRRVSFQVQETEFLPDPVVVIFNLAVFFSCLALEMCGFLQFYKALFLPVTRILLDPVHQMSVRLSKEVTWVAGDLG